MLFHHGYILTTVIFQGMDRVRVKNMDSGASLPGHVLALSLTSCVIFGQANISVPQFSYLQNG